MTLGLLEPVRILDPIDVDAYAVHRAVSSKGPRRPERHFRSNPVYRVHGVEVTVWDFDATASRSLNLFPDGTISDEYLLAKAPDTAPSPAAAAA